MVGIEIITSLLATSTAKAIAKFLDEKVGEYISKKFEDKPPSELGTLKKEIEDLKTSLQAKKKYRCIASRHSGDQQCYCEN